MNDFDPDRAKAARVFQALPPDARWLAALRGGAPLRRIPDWLAQAVFDTRETLVRDPIDFIAPEPAQAHQALIVALGELCHEFDGTFRPLARTAGDYTEVPPEWRSEDPDRYFENLRDLDRARQAVLDRYKELINVMNRRGQLPTPSSPDDQPSGQSIRITSGNDSPVTVNAPHAHASGGSTSTASTHQPPPSTAPSPGPPMRWYHSATWWTAVGALAAVAAAVAGFLALR